MIIHIFLFYFPSGICGGNLTATNSIQYLRLNETQYEDNMDCKWYITAPVGFSVIATITDMNLEGYSSNCYDYISFFEGCKCLYYISGSINFVETKNLQ